MEENKLIHNFYENNIEIVIEMPIKNNENELIIIEDIKKTMLNELFLQLNK